jgi:Fe-S cluster assembly scaffold protein SufB
MYQTGEPQCSAGERVDHRAANTCSLSENQAKSWEDLPPDIKQTWDRLGIPEAERKFLAGVGAQYESEVVYHKLQGLSPVLFVIAHSVGEE